MIQDPRPGDEPQLPSASVSLDASAAGEACPALDSVEPQALTGYLTIEMDVSALPAYIMEPRTPVQPAPREGHNGQESSVESCDWTDSVSLEGLRLDALDGLEDETAALSEYLTIEIEETGDDGLS